MLIHFICLHFCKE